MTLTEFKEINQLKKEQYLQRSLWDITTGKQVLGCSTVRTEQPAGPHQAHRPGVQRGSRVEHFPSLHQAKHPASALQKQTTQKSYTHPFYTSHKNISNNKDKAVRALFKTLLKAEKHFFNKEFVVTQSLEACCYRHTNWACCLTEYCPPQACAAERGAVASWWHSWRGYGDFGTGGLLGEVWPLGVYSPAHSRLTVFYVSDLGFLLHPLLPWCPQPGMDAPSGPGHRSEHSLLSPSCHPALS